MGSSGCLIITDDAFRHNQAKPGETSDNQHNQQTPNTSAQGAQGEGEAQVDPEGGEGGSGGRKIYQSVQVKATGGMDKVGSGHGPESHLDLHLAGRATPHHLPDSGSVNCLT